jgi:hypothetical protein
MTYNITDTKLFESNHHGIGHLGFQRIRFYEECRFWDVHLSEELTLFFHKVVYLRAESYDIHY